MGDTSATVLAIILLFVGLPILILWIIDRRRTRKRLRDNPPAAQIAERQAYERRILNPDWAFVERLLRRPAPQALRDLYADRALITRRDLPYADDYVISTFEALDEHALRGATSSLGFEALSIATTDFGDAVYIRPGTTKEDTVYLTHHDGGDTVVFAESVSEFLAKLKRA